MRTAALIRTWNDSGILAAVQRALNLTQLVLVVIDAPRDNEYTQRCLSVLNRNKQAQLRVLLLANPSWSNSLNEGLRFLARAWHPVAEDDLVLCLSVQAELGVQHWSALLEAMHDHAVAGVGPAFAGDVQGRSYEVVRNTCALWRLKTLLCADGFTTETDFQAGRHGMEDYEMFRRLKRLGWRVLRLDAVCVPLTIRHPENQREKERQEQMTMEEIDRWYQT